MEYLMDLGIGLLVIYALTFVALGARGEKPPYATPTED